MSVPRLFSLSSLSLSLSARSLPPYLSLSPPPLAPSSAIYAAYLSWTKYSKLSARKLKRAPPFYEQPWFFMPFGMVQLVCCE